MPASHARRRAMSLAGDPLRKACCPQACPGRGGRQQDQLVVVVVDQLGCEPDEEQQAHDGQAGSRYGSPAPYDGRHCDQERNRHDRAAVVKQEPDEECPVQPRVEQDARGLQDEIGVDLALGPAR